MHPNQPKIRYATITTYCNYWWGAAGFFAAIEAKRNFPHADITIFEKNSKVLAKVEITGGGRCNLTNSFDEISDLKQAYPRGHKLMKRLFKRFDYQHRRILTASSTVW